MWEVNTMKRCPGSVSGEINKDDESIWKLCYFPSTFNFTKIAVLMFRCGTRLLQYQRSHFSFHTSLSASLLRTMVSLKRITVADHYSRTGC